MSIQNIVVGGPLGSGTTAPGAATPDIGLATLAQSVTIGQNSTNAVSGTITLPANSQILNIFFDVLTAFDSATSATGTVGTSAGDSTYAGSINAKTGGRASITYNATAATALSNIGSNTSVVFTVTPIGATTAGSVLGTVEYIQK